VTREIVIGDSGAVTPAEADAFAAGIRSVVDETPERRTQRKDAARRAAASFSIDAIAERLEKMYLSALSDVAVAHS
jgi:glycosyltransferase involved in cell wall biosynthesis